MVMMLYICIVCNDVPVIRKSIKRVLDDDEDEEEEVKEEVKEVNVDSGNRNTLKLVSDHMIPMNVVEGTTETVHISSNSNSIVNNIQLNSNIPEKAVANVTGLHSNWTCRLCTFINTSKNRCRMCG